MSQKTSQRDFFNETGNRNYKKALDLEFRKSAPGV